MGAADHLMEFVAMVKGMGSSPLLDFSYLLFLSFPFSPSLSDSFPPHPLHILVSYSELLSFPLPLFMAGSFEWATILGFLAQPGVLITALIPLCKTQILP